MSETEITYDEINDVYGVYHNGELQGSVITRDMALHLVRFFERPLSPRASITQMVEDLVSQGFTRSQAIDHVLNDPDNYDLLMKARERRSKNPLPTRRAIYNWLKEHNQ